jgi:hypothetical protein
MSETPAPHSNEPLFTSTEIEKFDADDVVAGKAIGKMLSLLFLYTVFAMATVSLWTFNAVKARSQPQTPAAPHAGHH